MRRKVGTIPNTLNIQLEEGNYYEALQLYRTLQSRYEAAGKFKESDDLTYHGIVNMNKHNQTISAYDLAVVYLKSLKARSATFSIEIGDHLIDILSTFPPGEEKEKLISAFCGWCQSTGNALVGYPKLNDVAAKYYEEKKAYSTANDYYIISENMADYATMILNWAKEGYASEIDLFITRPILWLISKKNIRDATQFFKYIQQHTDLESTVKDLPLMHFCDFLLQTVVRDAAPVFTLLKDKYATELQRDPSFDKLLTEIGKIYFNIIPQNNMFANMMRMFTGICNNKMNEAVKRLYTNALMLAPMVRMNSFPFRLLCRKHGCNTVFSEEIVAMKLITCKRKINKNLGTIEYYDNKNELVFQTTEDEKKHLVFQMGVPTPELAVQAAKIIENDVSAIDINMGCPKQFSVQGNMGSALLKTPDIACSIVKGLSSNTKLPVSCKIRLLDGPIEKTIDFMKHLVDSGASAITLHLRYTDDRPRIPCHSELFSQVYEAMKAYAPNVPICYNGDIFTHEDVTKLRTQYPHLGLMIGRGAILNMGVFEGKDVDYNDSNREFMRLSAQYNNCFSNVKFIVFRVITEGKRQFTEAGDIVHNAHDWETLGSVYGIGQECIDTLLKLKEKGEIIDENLTIENAGLHRKSKKRDKKEPKQDKSNETENKKEL